MKTNHQILADFVRKYASYYTYDPSHPLYHGTSKDFESLKLSSNGLLWLTPSREAAIAYSDKHWEKAPTKYLWTVQLKSNAKILSLGNLSNKTIREIYESISDLRRSTFGPIKEEDWLSFADFGILEGYQWVKGFLKKRKVDGVTCADRAASQIDHDSVALLRLPAIQSATRETL